MSFCGTVDVESRLSDTDHRRQSYQSQRMTDFYFYLSRQDSLDVRKNNSLSDLDSTSQDLLPRRSVGVRPETDIV